MVEGVFVAAGVPDDDDEPVAVVEEDPVGEGVCVDVENGGVPTGVVDGSAVSPLVPVGVALPDDVCAGLLVRVAACV